MKKFVIFMGIFCLLSYKIVYSSNSSDSNENSSLGENDDFLTDFLEAQEQHEQRLEQEKKQYGPDLNKIIHDYVWSQKDAVNRDVLLKVLHDNMNKLNIKEQLILAGELESLIFFALESKDMELLEACLGLFGLNVKTYRSMDQGKSLLHIAIDLNDLNLLKRLIGAGADIRGTDKEGRTPKDYAVWLDKIKGKIHEEIITYLEKIHAPSIHKIA